MGRKRQTGFINERRAYRLRRGIDAPKARHPKDAQGERAQEEPGFLFAGDIRGLHRGGGEAELEPRGVAAERPHHHSVLAAEAAVAVMLNGGAEGVLSDQQGPHSGKPKALLPANQGDTQRHEHGLATKEPGQGARAAASAVRSEPAEREGQAESMETGQQREGEGVQTQATGGGQFGALVSKLCAAQGSLKELLDSELSQDELATLQEATATPERLLAGLLRFSLPGWIDRCRLMTWAEIQVRREPLVDIITGQGDVFARSAKPGQAARAFNALAETLAIFIVSSPDGEDAAEDFLAGLEGATPTPGDREP